MRRTGWLVMTAAALPTATGLLAAPAAAAPDSAATVDCAGTRTYGSRLEVSCYNPDSAAGVVDVFYVCSTPLDFDRRIVFDEPGNYIAAGSMLILARDCGAQQRVITYQVQGYTEFQRDDMSQRQQQIREKRDRAAGR
ncbi:hypothetical protein [Nocardia yamanashiensis]|uniref:hypothetical protein n=1 Tax=Nocardia yamanashiensis TaxID=209247 RepID=UPI00082C46CF|nr:hypothetical protein [Nocardia yamanashiensis]